jgi:hypothetical protein
MACKGSGVRIPSAPPTGSAGQRRIPLTCGFFVGRGGAIGPDAWFIAARRPCYSTGCHEPPSFIQRLICFSGTVPSSSTLSSGVCSSGVRSAEASDSCGGRRVGSGGRKGSGSIGAPWWPMSNSMPGGGHLGQHPHCVSTTSTHSSSGEFVQDSRGQSNLATDHLQCLLADRASADHRDRTAGLVQEVVADRSQQQPGECASSA